MLRSICLLGSRYLVQGAAELTVPDPRMVRAAAVIDAIHGLSIVRLACARPTTRRAAAANAALAAMSALAAISGASTRASHAGDHWRPRTE